MGLAVIHGCLQLGAMFHWRRQVYYRLGFDLCQNTIVRTELWLQVCCCHGNGSKNYDNVAQHFSSSSISTNNQNDAFSEKNLPFSSNSRVLLPTSNSFELSFRANCDVLQVPAPNLYFSTCVCNNILQSRTFGFGSF